MSLHTATQQEDPAPVSHAQVDGGKKKPTAAPFRSVDTPVAKRPVDATASEPPKSTRLAIVPPWMVLRRFCVKTYEQQKK